MGALPMGDPGFCPRFPVIYVRLHCFPRTLRWDVSAITLPLPGISYLLTIPIRMVADVRCS